MITIKDMWEETCNNIPMSEEEKQEFSSTHICFYAGVLQLMAVIKSAESKEEMVKSLELVDGELYQFTLALQEKANAN